MISYNGLIIPTIVFQSKSPQEPLYSSLPAICHPIYLSKSVSLVSASHICTWLGVIRWAKEKQQSHY